MARRPMPRSRRSWILSIVTSANSSQRTRLKGIAAAPGQAFAPAWRWTEPSLESARPAAAGQLGADELERAVEQVKARLAVTTARLHAGGASAEAGILEAQALMLEDPALLEGARELVLNGTPADVAVADTMAPFAAMLRESPDPVFQARAAVQGLGGPAALAVDAEPAVTRDGRRVEVGSNAANLEDAQRAAAAGADGIGLLRSEFLFLGSDQLPTEDEQVAMLEAVTTAMGHRPVILRTLDVGADKPLPALPQPSEANPALGVRGLRLQLLRRPDLLADQVRAALRVAAKHPLRLMFPMVSTLDEVRQAKAILAQAVSDINAVGTNGPRMPVGIMVEVPAAAIGADLLAREVDFFSLGTNDLTQYLFAADRTHPELGPLADSLHPAVLRMIDQVVKAAHRHRRWVGVCGEMASDVWAVPLLVGLGVDELSVHPPMVARVKATVRQLNAADCEKVVAAALELESGDSVRRLLEQRHLEPSSLRMPTGR